MWCRRGKRGASSTSPTLSEAPWEAVPHEGHAIINVLACGTDARAVHRVMQLCEAAIEDWDNVQENNGQMRGSKLYRRHLALSRWA